MQVLTGFTSTKRTAVYILLLVIFFGCVYSFDVPIDCEDDIVKEKHYHTPLSKHFPKEDPNEIVLIRILSNDLPPRHDLGQTIRNVRFMLEHEEPFPGCTKLWLVNRVFNKTQENEIIQLLEHHKQIFRVLPFHLSEWIESYKTGGYHISTRYSTDTNFGRNVALDEARNIGYKYILAWDGNEYLTLDDYSTIKTHMYQRTDCQHFVVPIVRVPGDNEKYLLTPNDHEWETRGEPQLIFTEDFKYNYENRSYGEESKNYLVNMLAKESPTCAGDIGRVYRLFSGGAASESSLRGMSRMIATLYLHHWLYQRAITCGGLIESKWQRRKRLGPKYGTEVKVAQKYGYSDIHGVEFFDWSDAGITYKDRKWRLIIRKLQVDDTDPLRPQ